MRRPGAASYQESDQGQADGNEPTGGGHHGDDPVDDLEDSPEAGGQQPQEEHDILTQESGPCVEGDWIQDIKEDVLCNGEESCGMRGEQPSGGSSCTAAGL